MAKQTDPQSSGDNASASTLNAKGGGRSKEPSDRSEVDRSKVVGPLVAQENGDGVRGIRHDRRAA